ncbi:MAG: prepilin peptidase [Subdoligranulum sp.]|nr:prepilin peptidase [Subdoligranulum sp.]
MDIAITMILASVFGLLVSWCAADKPLKREQIAGLLGDAGWQRKMVLLFAAMMGIGAYGLWLFGMGRDLVGFLLLAAYLVSITPEDVKTHTISSSTTCLYLLLFVLFKGSGFEIASIVDGLMGAATGFILLGIPYLVRKESIGWGDVTTVSVCGILLGFPHVIYFILRAFFAIFVYSVVQLLRKKVNLKSETAFAPFLLFAALI